MVAVEENGLAQLPSVPYDAAEFIEPLPEFCVFDRELQDMGLATRPDVHGVLVPVRLLTPFTRVTP